MKPFLLVANALKSFVFAFFAYWEGYGLLHDVPYRWQYIPLAYVILPVFAVIAGCETIFFDRRKEYRVGVAFLSWTAIVLAGWSTTSLPESSFPLVAFSIATACSLLTTWHVWLGMRVKA
jgi:hypothetical protein